MDFKTPISLIVLFVYGCSSTGISTVQPPGDLRRHAIIEKTAIIQLQEISKPSFINPYLVIHVSQQIIREETSYRPDVEKKERKHTDRLSIWISSVLATSVGYGAYQNGNEELGLGLVGIGAFMLLSGKIFGGQIDSIKGWNRETRTLPPKNYPLKKTPLKVVVGDSFWEVATDSHGNLKMDVSSLADKVAPGGPLTIEFVLAADTAKTFTALIPAEVMDYYRPTLITEKAENVQEIENFPSTRAAPTIAILDFEGIGISEEETRLLTIRLGTYLAQSDAFLLIEREKMQTILEEQDLQLTGCTSNECAVEIGQILGAERMLAGAFGRTGALFTIDMRVIDVETGHILRTFAHNFEGAIDHALTEGLKEVIRQFTQQE